MEYNLTVILVSCRVILGDAPRVPEVWSSLVSLQQWYYK